MEWPPISQHLRNLAQLTSFSYRRQSDSACGISTPPRDRGCGTLSVTDKGAYRGGGRCFCVRTCRRRGLPGVEEEECLSLGAGRVSAPSSEAPDGAGSLHGPERLAPSPEPFSMRRRPRRTRGGRRTTKRTGPPREEDDSPRGADGSDGGTDASNRAPDAFDDEVDASNPGPDGSDRGADGSGRALNGSGRAVNGSLLDRDGSDLAVNGL